MRFATFALFALACGAPSEDLFYDSPDAGPELEYTPRHGQELGTAEQAIYRNGEFGGDSQDGYRCDVFSSFCTGAQSKTIRLYFLAGTCSSWWQARFVELDQQMTALLAPYGWTVVGAGNGPWDLRMRCASTLGGQPVDFASHVNGGGAPTLTQLPNGIQWAQYPSGEMAIDTAEVAAFPAWQVATDVQRKRFASEALEHEFGHFMGLGHVLASANAVMSESVQTTNVNLPPWTYFNNYTAVEQQWLDCYDPTSDTMSDC